MAGVVHVPWYATGLRHDQLAAALAEIAPVSLRYGARSYAVYRSRDDLYKFLQMAEARAAASGLYQVPVLPQWLRVVDAGELSTIPS